MIYQPASGRDLDSRTGRGNVLRDVAREILSAISGLTLLGPKGGVVWRGQADASWRLESKMGRLGLSAREMAKQERMMLAEARRVGADNAQHLGDWEILARLRHHGAATRLVDFTTDPLVALWFLCEDTSQVAGGSVRDQTGVLLAMQREELGTVKSPYMRNYNSTIDGAGSNLLYRTPPIDPRIAAQRGVFAFSTNPLSSAACTPSELGLPIPKQNWISGSAERLSKICDTEKWANRTGRPIEVFPQFLGIAVP